MCYGQELPATIWQYLSFLETGLLSFGNLRTGNICYAKIKYTSVHKVQVRFEFYDFTGSVRFEFFLFLLLLRTSLVRFEEIIHVQRTMHAHWD